MVRAFVSVILGSEKARAISILDVTRAPLNWFSFGVRLPRDGAAKGSGGEIKLIERPPMFGPSRRPGNSRQRQPMNGACVASANQICILDALDRPSAAAQGTESGVCFSLGS